MAGKKIEYQLEYRENGERRLDVLNISFVSNYCVREYNSLMSIVFDVQNKWDELSDIISEIAAIKAGGESGKTIEQLEEEKEKLESKILVYNDDKIEMKRFELIKTILADNGIKDQKYFDFDFWDRQVEPGVQIDFLTQCAFKDIDKKKVM